MTFSLLVRGDRACFRRPEFAIDLISYDVITPVAARRLFEVAYHPPSTRWIIDRVVVLHPIRLHWIEIPDRHRPDRLRRIHALQDVAYVVDARLELTECANGAQALEDHEATFREKMKRLARRPFLGLTDFVADVELLRESNMPSLTVGAKMSMDLGWMLYDTSGAMRSGARFFRAALVDGVMTVPYPDAAVFAS